jgi:hypothetical protein
MTSPTHEGLLMNPRTHVCSVDRHGVALIDFISISICVLRFYLELYAL